MKPRKGNVSAGKQVKGLKLPRRKKRLDDARMDYPAAVNLAKHLDLRFTVRF